VAASDSSGNFEFGRFAIRPAERRLLVNGGPVALGARAFDLLLTLAEHRDRVVSKNELLDLVWPGLIVEENNLQVQISTLRRILGPQAIATVPGRGYRFTATAAAAAVVAPGKAPTPDRSLGNLPESVSTLYGRDQDLAALLALLRSHRLVTLTGAGGIGKSTLALAAARAERGRWENGVWQIELAAVADPALVPGTVAQALEIQLAGRKTQLDELVDALRSQEILLLLDNCEHLLAAAAQLADAVLARSRAVRILTTSQEPLHVEAEQQFRVPPLAIPTEAHSVHPADYGALELFEARVQAIDPRFRLGPDNLDAAIEICRRLDCLPLAIELAAARVPLLGVEGVRGRLDDRFRILTSGRRVAPTRHQTLRTAIEWSHSLLTADEQAVFRRLGVFHGSFGLDTAQRVAGGPAIEEWAVIDHLGTLVDKSLVVPQEGEVPRYRLLETARALASEKLEGAGEAEAIRRAHADAMLATFERSFQQQWRRPTSLLLSLNLPDLDNLRAAFEWAKQSPCEGELLIAIAGASAWIWGPAGLGLEGVQRCMQALDRITETTPTALDAALVRQVPFQYGSTTARLRPGRRALSPAQ